jgi:DUF1009 family protein
MSENKNIKKLAIIAGAGSLPKQVADSCKKQKIDYIVIGLEGQTSKDKFAADEIVMHHLHAVSKILKTMQKAGVTHVVLAGRVSRASISKLLLDVKGAMLFARIITHGLNDNSVLLSVIKFLESEGFTLVPPEKVAKDIVLQKGCFTKTKPDDSATDDIQKGIKILKGIAQYDVGQALVIQEGLVLGVEAAEGTDELIKRCGQIQQKLGEKSGLLIKCTKPQQDKRVDLPCIGPNTIRNLHEYGLRGVAAEAGGTLMLDGKETIKLADELGIFIYGF